MTVAELLARGSHASRRTDVARLATTLAAVILLSSVWYAVRPRLVRHLACSSIGGMRDDLIGAALRQEGADLEQGALLWSHSRPRPGWIVRGKFLDDPSYSGYELLDSDLRVRGRFRGVVPWGWWTLCFRPRDAETKGPWEIIVSQQAQDGAYCAVLSLGTVSNELLWLGFVRRNPVGTLDVPVWTSGPEGQPAIAFMRWLPGAPLRTVAIFEFDTAGRLVRPRLLPHDAAFTFWSPPADARVTLERDDPLGDTFERLLPVPP